MTTEKAIALTRRTFVGRVMSLLFDTLSRFVIAFLPRSKRLFISWVQSTLTVILEAKKIKSVTVSIVFPSVYNEVMELDAMVLVFWMLSFKPAFSLSSFILKRLFSSSSLSTIRVVSSVYLSCCYFSWQPWFQLVIYPAQHFAWCTLRETWVWSLGGEDPLEKEMATHSSILAWRIPWTEEPGRLQSSGSQRVGHDSVTSPHLTSLCI